MQQRSRSAVICAFFIPGINFVLVPLILRSAWKGVLGGCGGLLIFFWWLFWLLEIALNVSRSLNYFPDEFGPEVVQVWIYSGIFAPVLAYGLLWYIVKSINARVGPPGALPDGLSRRREPATMVAV